MAFAGAVCLRLSRAECIGLIVFLMQRSSAAEFLLPLNNQPCRDIAVDCTDPVLILGLDPDSRAKDMVSVPSVIA